MDVVLPDGTPIRALPLAERRADADERDFGLYMDDAWAPTWSADLVSWPDFGLPAAPEAAAAQIRDAYERARAGQRVEIGCRGGLGRTGTVLACMAVLAGASPSDAVDWVRRNYHPSAVETPEQEAWVEWFAGVAEPRRGRASAL